MGNKSRTSSKGHGIKGRCYWEHIGNTLGTTTKGNHKLPVDEESG
jgi:hypothetical protein